MFGELLKEFRIVNGYTQKDLAIKLANKSDEFQQIDFVTISRWERGITSPNNAKALRVLGCLIMDVQPFLKSLYDYSSSTALDNFMVERFGAKELLSTLAAFNIELPSNKQEFGFGKVIKEVNDPILKRIREYHTLFNQERLDLFNVDLYLYQEEHKLHGYRFYYESKPENIIAHSISFFIDTEELEEEVRDNGCDIDIRIASKYKSSGRYSMYLASGTITSEDLFKYHWIQQIKFLSTHSNIDKFYTSVMSETVVPFLLSIGFEVVATKNPVKVGGIKIGRRRYERCLMKIDTSVLLTSKEALSLIADYL